MSAGAVRAGKVFVEVGADTKAFNSAMRGLATSVNDVGRELAGIGAKFAAIGGAAAGGMIAATVAFGSAGSALLDMSKKTGLSVESLSKLGFAAEQNGATLEDVSKGVINLNRSFAEASSGSKEATAAFARLGLSMAQLSGMSPEERFRAIVGALAAIPDPAVRAALAMQLFGKAGVQLLPMIADGTAGLDEMARKAEELGIVMSTDSAKSANAFGSALTSMHRAVGAISNAIGSALAPSLTEIAKILTINAAAIARYLDKNKDLVQMALKVSAGIFATGVALSAFGNAMLGLTRGVTGLVQVFNLLMSPITIAGKALYVLGTAARLAIGPLSTIGSAALSGFGVVARASLSASSAVISFGVSATQSLAGFAASAATTSASAVASAARISAAFLGPVAQSLAKFGMGFGKSLIKDLAAIAAPATNAISMAAKVGAAWATSAAKPIAAFAVQAAASIGAYVTAIAVAVAETVVATATMAAAWLSGIATAIGTFVAGVAVGIGTYVAAIALAVSETVVGTALMAGAWIANAMPATAAFAVAAAGSIGAYVAGLAVALGATVVSTATMAVAWVSSAAAGVATWAAGCLAGVGSYLGGVAMALAGTVASTAAMAAAWLLPLAPFLLLGAAVAGAGALFYSFGGSISGALAPVADLASTAGSSIATAFSGVVADASVVFGDLKATAVSTFGGISDAISSGDLAGAATMLWLGLTAGFLRGMAGIMSYVNPWLEGLQNAFGDIGTAVYTTWDSLWTTLAALTNTAGAVMMGAIDNIVNGIMAAFDNLVANIQIAWIRVTGFLSGAKDTEKRVAAVKNKNEARAVERDAARPGIAGRTAKADKENKQARTESNDRVAAAEDANAQDRQDRADRTKADAARRQEGVAAADAAVAGKRAELGANKDAMAVEGTVGSAKTTEDLRDLYAEVERLRAAGASAESLDRLTESIDNQALEVDKARAIEEQDTEAKKKSAEQTAADVAATPLGKTAEVVGSFSASGAGMGFGATTTTEKQLETLKAIHETLKKQEMERVSE